MKKLTKNGTGQPVMSNAAVVAAKLVEREEVKTRSRMLAYERVASQVGKSACWVTMPRIAQHLNRSNAAVHQILYPRGKP